MQRLSIYIVMTIACCCISCEKQQDPLPEPDQIVVATMGASLIETANGWVEQACGQLGVRCLNKAVGGQRTHDFAKKLWSGTYASPAQQDQIDIMLIQFANCNDVCGDESTLLPTADDYTRNYTRQTKNPFEEYSHAQQMDYILKKWQQICEQRHKPMHVILVTHWHDGRVTYNESVRRLAQRWNAEVCELDKNIGFTKDKPLPDGRQPSVLYAKDTEMIDGVEFGFHPLRGEDGNYIQSVMAGILEDKLQEYIQKHSIQ